MAKSLDPLICSSDFDLNTLNRKFAASHPRDILKWCLANVPTGLVQVSQFGIDDLVITDLLYRELQPSSPVPVIFLDTLHHFPQTLDLVAKAKDYYQLLLQVYKVSNVATRKAFSAKYGKALWEADRHRFDYLTKEEPLQNGLVKSNAIAWIAGCCQDYDAQLQTSTKAYPFELDQHGRLKINPLATWMRKESWAYAYEYDVLYNPLYDEGYSMIGDEPLTVPVGD